MIGPSGQQLAEAAARFIGVRFKLLGRDPVIGLDCVGLVACSLEAIGHKPKVPHGYRLRNTDATGWINCAKQSGLLTATGAIQLGDIVLTNPGPGQSHLVIAESTSMAIHAHAGIRRIVRQPMDLPKIASVHWRLP